MKNKCDWCGNHPVEIKRRYKDEGYCANCYRVWFIKKPCSRCEKIKRLHKKEEYPICLECRRNQPCKRCGKAAYLDGFNTEYGRVCRSCYQNHFKKKKVCQGCGVKKTNVSRYNELNHNEEVCVSCYQKQTRKTCTACKRFRKVIETPKGGLCEKCHQFGEINCPCCGNKMPAGQGKRCLDCYWNSRLEHETKLNQYLFKSDEVKKAYKDFINWFLERSNSMHVVLTHLKFTLFFKTCDELWQKIPLYENLIQEFKPDGLRHYLTVLRWLIETEQIIVDLKVKAEVAEQERIYKLLNKFDIIPTSVQLYYEFLNQKLELGKTSLKSIRLALQPAVDIYIDMSINTQQLPSQEHLDDYLKQKRGQFNAIYGFISHINRTYKTNLECTEVDPAILRKEKRKKLETKLIILHEKLLPTEKDNMNWILTSLEYFHNLKVSKRLFSALSIIDNGDRLIVNCSKVIGNYNSKYVIPSLEKYKA